MGLTNRTLGGASDLPLFLHIPPLWQNSSEQQSIAQENSKTQFLFLRQSLGGTQDSGEDKKKQGQMEKS